MAYAQRNYNQLQGTNRTHRIAQVGCFLTAFSNLTLRFGRPSDPLKLNQEFINRNIWQQGDLLAFSSISQYDPSIVITGSGAGAPTSDNSIVKFLTNTNNFGTHFALVKDASAGTIVDSWDGQIKSWNVYGGPVEWVAYKDTSSKTVSAPKPVKQPNLKPTGETLVLPMVESWAVYTYGSGLRKGTSDQLGSLSPARTGVNRFAIYGRRGSDIATIKTQVWGLVDIYIGTGTNAVVERPIPKAKPVPKPEPAKKVNYHTVTVQDGWGISHALKSVGYTQDQFSNEHEWARFVELNNGKSRLHPGDVVKVYKTPLDIAPAPVQKLVEKPVSEPITAHETDDNAVPVTIIKKDPNEYKRLARGIDAIYTAKSDGVVFDLDGKLTPKPISKGQTVHAVEILAKDGVEYVRTQKSVDNGWYYAISTDMLVGDKNLEYVGEYLPDDDDAMFDDIISDMESDKSRRDVLVDLVSRLYGAYIKVLKTLKLKK